MEPTDEVLCQRVANRDEAAFDLLVARYQERAYRLAPNECGLLPVGVPHAWRGATPGRQYVRGADVVRAERETVPAS